MMESEAQRPMALAPDVTTALAQLVAGTVTYGMRNSHPVALAEGIRRQLMPILSEVTVLSMRLGMAGDSRLKAACVRAGAAAAALLKHLDEHPCDYAKREAELEASVGQLRRARDAAAAPRWRRRKMRRRVTDG
jgi:hypothetical protein